MACSLGYQRSKMQYCQVPTTPSYLSQQLPTGKMMSAADMVSAADGELNLKNRPLVAAVLAIIVRQEQCLVSVGAVCLLLFFCPFLAGAICLAYQYSCFDQHEFCCGHRALLSTYSRQADQEVCGHIGCLPYCRRRAVSG